MTVPGHDLVLTHPFLTMESIGSRVIMEIWPAQRSKEAFLAEGRFRAMLAGVIPGLSACRNCGVHLPEEGRSFRAWSVAGPAGRTAAMVAHQCWFCGYLNMADIST